MVDENDPYKIFTAIKGKGTYCSAFRVDLSKTSRSDLETLALVCELASVGARARGSRQWEASFHNDAARIRERMAALRETQ
jgi:hypothetical protein